MVDTNTSFSSPIFSKPKINCTIPSSHLSFSRSPRARAHRTPPTCGHSHWPRGGRPAGRRDGSSPVPYTHTAHACALAARWRGRPPESHFLRPRSRDTSIGTFWYPPAPAGTTRSRVWSTPFFFPPLPFGCPPPPHPPPSHHCVTPPVPFGGTARRPPLVAGSTVSARRPPCRHSPVAAVWRNRATPALLGPARGARGVWETADRGQGGRSPAAPTPLHSSSPPSPRVARVRACVLRAALVGKSPAPGQPRPATARIRLGGGAVQAPGPSFFFFFGGRSSCLDVGAQGGEGEGGWGETGSEASGLCARRCCTAHHPPPSPFWHFSHAVRGSPLPSTAPLPSPPPSLWAPTRATALGRIVGRCWPRRPVGGATRR